MMANPQQRKKEQKKMQKEGRLPPGQSLTKKFPVLHYGSVPEVDLSEWVFRIWGEVEEERRWTWEEFNALPTREVKMDVHCVTRWSKFDTVWKGVSVKGLVEEGIVKPLPSANFVTQHAAGGYTTNLPLDIIMQDNFLLATHLDGEPITPDHGYPLRGVVGHMPEREDMKTVYFWKGAKWLRGLEFRTEDKKGFWEEAGYHNEGDVWKEQRRA
ncbi:MAG: molybdopterin-dependent oxidoreductase [Anaerolineales bacterium]|nr:molybdopterin-dependent oxidoreductase [Anaerolineales bacterium]MBS3752483.1 molybdopterin-dependent oxidoreductase [Anaerolineales bacterium]